MDKLFLTMCGSLQMLKVTRSCILELNYVSCKPGLKEAEKGVEQFK